MNRIKITPRWKKTAGEIALVIILFTCTFGQCVWWQDGDYLQFEKMTVPAGSEFTITVKALFTPQEECDGTRMVLSILVPKIWNVSKGNAVFTYEVTNVDEGVILPMYLIPDEISPKNNQWQGLTWAQALSSLYGVGHNIPGSDMEWVSFWSDPNDMYNLINKVVTIYIKIKTSNDNVKCKLGFFLNHSDDGISNDSQMWQVTLMDEPFETTGAPGGVIDFCEEHPNSEIPMFVTKDDILTIRYSSGVKVTNLQGDTVNTALYGASDVYLCASAYTSSGKHDVIEASGKTQMLLENDNIYSLTFWPASYFNIPEEEQIDRIEYYFVNADQSIQVKKLNEDGSESPFVYLFDCR